MQDEETAGGVRPRRAREARSPKSCHERALGLLAVRSRSRRELESRLRGAGFPGEEVAEVLARLERVGLIDDEAFAREVAEHRFRVRREGGRAVTSELLSKGVAPDIVARVLDGSGGALEEDRAQELARSRASRLAGVDPAKAFNRLTSLLMRRGYGPEVARRAARNALDVTEEEE